MTWPPCKDCPDRREACHDSCEKYAEYRAEKAELKAKEKAKKEFGRDVEFRARQLMLRPKRRHR